jgi:hypothetical protein
LGLISPQYLESQLEQQADAVDALFVYQREALSGKAEPKGLKMNKVPGLHSG